MEEISQISRLNLKNNKTSSCNEMTGKVKSVLALGASETEKRPESQLVMVSFYKPAAASS